MEQGINLSIIRAINALGCGSKPGSSDAGINAVDEAVTDSLEPEQVEKLAEKYPYFTLPAVVMLRGDYELMQEQRRKFTRQLAGRATSTIVLNTLLNEENESFYPDEQNDTPSTEKAIDTFLSTYGSGDADEDVLNKLIFNPTPDYAQLLAQEEQQNVPELEPEGDSHDDLLNRFIIKQKQQEGSIPQEEPSHIPTETVENRHSDETPEGQADTSLLSESLAKIFIRQKQYERAYEIITQLSLKYPEKSVYFADQMRFLRKVINNRRHKEASKEQ